MLKSVSLMSLLLVCAVGTSAEAPELRPRVATVGKVRVLDVSGSYYEMGKAHGKLLRADVRATVRMFTGIEGKPTAEQQEMESRWRQTWIKHVPARYREEMRGLADGAGLPLDQIEFAQADGTGFADARAMALFGTKTIGGKPFLTQSVKFVRFTEAIVIVYHPRDGNAYALITCPGCITGLAGMNRRGIAITANPAYHENYSVEYVPAGFLVRDALRQTSDLPQTVTYLRQATPADHALFLVAQGKKPACRVIERTPQLTALFDQDDPAERTETFRPLADCVRRSFRYVDPQLDNTLSFHCGFFALSMFDRAKENYEEMTRYVQGLSQPASVADVMRFLRAFKDNSRDDFQVIFRPGDLDFWLARAKPGESEKHGARFQESQHFDLRRLLGMPLL